MYIRNTAQRENSLASRVLHTEPMGLPYMCHANALFRELKNMKLAPDSFRFAYASRNMEDERSGTPNSRSARYVEAKKVNPWLALYSDVRAAIQFRNIKHARKRRQSPHPKRHMKRRYADPSVSLEAIKLEFLGNKVPDGRRAYIPMGKEEIAPHLDHDLRTLGHCPSSVILL